MSRIDYQKLREMREKISLPDLCRTGFFFCNGCGRITEKHEETGACIICKSPRVKWCPPALPQ